MVSYRSILHVEDNDAEALLVQRALEEIAPPLRCKRVSDVDRALKMLDMVGRGNAAPPCLILLDLNLPPRSGYDVLKQVRECQALAAVPVVIFSSLASPADKRNSLSLGALAHIGKPSTFDEYVAALREVVSMIPVE